MTLSPLPVDSHLTAITLSFANENYIADKIFPRVAVNAQEFSYWKSSIADGFTLPQSETARSARPNQVNFSANRHTAYTLDYALDDLIPQNDIDNSPSGHNPLSKATERLSDLILLGHEKRIADLVSNADSYANGHTITLSGTNKVSHNDSDPVKTIFAGMDKCTVRPNVIVLGHEVFIHLARNSKVIKACYGVEASSGGMVNREALATLFGVKQVLVGTGHINTQAKGKTPSLTPIWGNFIALLHQNPNVDTHGGVTFGFTAQWRERFATTIEDPHLGYRGGRIVRVGESVKELVVAGEAGYLIKSAI